jgi:tetratricopeptide (TPR) repeat protein
MRLRKGFVVLLITLMMSSLAACDSAEEQAEQHYQSALELIAAGDLDRAVVEFRNVFKLNPSHKEARLGFAQLQEQRGNLSDAYGQYLRLVEQTPDSIEALRALARLAADQGNWAEADRHVAVALSLVPGDKDLLAVQTGSAYAKAIADTDTAARHAAAETARKLLVDLPQNILLRRVSIDDLLQDQKLDQALTELDAAQALAPNEQSFYMMRLAALSSQDRQDEIETVLKQMVEVFPEDPTMGATLVRWYVSRKDLDKAEAFLRTAIDPASPDFGPARLTLVAFLSQFRGPDAALAELDKIIEANKTAEPAKTTGETAEQAQASAASPAMFRAMRASILFDRGEQDQAITEMEQVLAGAEPSDEQRNLKTTLARMKQVAGNSVGARALVEEVLAEDAGHVEALKLKAAWLIDDDDLATAISLLRSALDAKPQDAQIMTLMARAYERDGNPELMGEMLSLAVQASNSAPAESLRLAAYLEQQDKLIPAETVLIDALRLDRTNVSLLVPLGNIYVGLKDWGRATSVADSLLRLDTPEATTAAQTLRAAILQAQNKATEALDYLQGLVEEGSGGAAAQLAILRTHLTNGDTAKALAYSGDLLATDPQNAALRFMNAVVKDAAGDKAGAEKMLRDLVAEDSGRLAVWNALYRQMIGLGRTEDAAAVLDQALAALPDAPDLLWAKAGALERAGDIEGAIAIYQAMYDKDSSNAIIANNLASLLSGFRDDPESLERAFAVAKRLRGSTLPPFQDTYGWLLHLRGETEEALDYLEPAALGLADDPVVQFHLASVYQALKRPQEAMAQYQKVLALVGELDTRPFVVTSRTELARLQGSTGN